MDWVADFFLGWRLTMRSRLLFVLWLAFACGGRTGLGRLVVPEESDGGEGGAPPSGPRIVLFGGRASGGSRTRLADTWEWDGARWTQLNVPGPPGRSDHLMSPRGSSIVLYGGSFESGFADDTWEWDGHSWSKKADTGPGGRAGFAMATLHDRVVVFGGTGAAPAYGDTWVWDGVTWTLATTRGPAPRYGAAMATLGDHIVLYGGLAPTGAPKYAETWLWDGQGWSNAGNGTPGVQSFHSMVTLGDSVVLFGAQGDTWLWKGSVWTAASPGPSGRSETPMATLGNVCLLFGGFIAGGTTAGDTWTWDGTAWTGLQTTGPSSRYAHAMAAR